jgi:hypothetical protein
MVRLFRQSNQPRLRISETVLVNNTEMLSSWWTVSSIGTHWYCKYIAMRKCTCVDMLSNFSVSSHEIKRKMCPDEIMNCTQFSNQYSTKNQLHSSEMFGWQLIQAEGETLLSAIHKLIRSIWNKEELPDQRKEPILLPIHKKGCDKTDCNNYHGISHKY